MADVESAGKIEAELRLNLTQMEKDALGAQKKMDAMAAKLRKQGADTGKGFAAGMKNGFNQTADNAAKLGKSIATKLSPALLGITAGIKIIGSLAAGFKDAMMANEKFSKAVNGLKEAAGQSFANAVKPISDFFAGVIQKAVESAAKTKAFREELARTRGEIGGGEIGELAAQIEHVNSALAGANEELKHIEIAERGGQEYYLGLKIEEARADALKVRNKLLEESADLTSIQGNASLDILKKEEEAYKVLGKSIADINILLGKNNIDREAADEQRLSAIKTYIETVSLIPDAEKVATGKIAAHLQDQMRERDRLQNSLKKETFATEKTDEEKINEARIAALEKYRQAEQRARDEQKAGLINELEMKKQIDSADAAMYSDLEAIATQYKLTAESAGRYAKEVISLRDKTAELVKETQGLKWLDETRKGLAEEIAEQEINQLKAQAASAWSEKQKNALLEKALELEIEIMNKKREKEREDIINSASFKSRTKEEKEEILAAFDAITKARENAMRTSDKNKNWLAEALGMTDEGFDKMMTVGQSTIDAYQGIADAALEVTRQHAEEQIAGIERSLEKMLETIEEAREAELEAKGFMEAQSEEEFDRQIERAKEAGDEVLQYHLSRRKEELEINKRYDAQVKAAEEKAARDKADIEFKLAKQEHAMQIIQATNAAAMAILMASKNMWPIPAIPMMAMAGTAAGVQIGLLIANPPKYPHFADGGIVPGRKSDGDVQHVLATAGEVILNEAQQKNVAGKLESREYIQLTVVMQMDGREVAQVSADVYGSGRVTIPVRGIAG